MTHRKNDRQVRKEMFFIQGGCSTAPNKVGENLLKQHGPQNVNNCWKLAETVGIKSKAQMKTIERHRVKISCNHVKHAGQRAVTQSRGGKQLKSGQGFKEFIFGIKPKNPKKKQGSSKLDESDNFAKLDEGVKSAEEMP
ncbi:hypothetical protein L7F22_005293 [Adiantum nelumboides]|nr:hypothetical protein [Adiantum nelumboides]